VGRVFSQDELTRLAEVCLRRGLAIVADEIHCELTLAGHRHTPIASLAPEIADRTITLMARARPSTSPGSSARCRPFRTRAAREVRRRARGSRPDGQRLGYTRRSAYRDGQPWLDELLRYLEANRDFVAEYVRTRLPGVKMAPPEATYLAWLDCRNAGPAARDPFTFFLEEGEGRVQ